MTSRARTVTAVVCAGFDATTDEAIYAVRDRVRAAGCRTVAVGRTRRVATRVHPRRSVARIDTLGD